MARFMLVTLALVACEKEQEYRFQCCIDEIIEICACDLDEVCDEEAFVDLGDGTCESTSYTYTGYMMAKQFPMDGQREWQYLNDAENVSFPMRVEKLTAPIMKGDIAVYTFEYYNGDTSDIARSVDWSSDSINGVLIHAYVDHENGAKEITFEPPIVFAATEMAPGDRVETKTGGRTFTSTLVGTEPCPNHWSPDWEACLKVVLDDGDGDDSTGALVAGKYWLVPSYGTAIFQMTPDADKWRLLDFAWSSE